MDNLEEVRQTFIAEVSDYVEKVKLAADEATSFAGHVERVNIALNGMTEKLTTAAVALGITRDEMGRLRDKAGEVITATEAEARALKHLRDQAAEAAFAMRELGKYQEQRGGLLSRLGGLLGLGGGAGDLAGAAGAAESGIGGLASSAGMIAAAIPAIMGALTAAGALLTGLTAAGAGIGALGIVAISNYQAAATAARKVQLAQDAYNVSVAHGVKQATAYRTEQIAIGKAYAELSPAQVQLSQQVGAMQSAWQSFIQANTPLAAQVLGQVFGIIRQLMPYISQFATLAGPAISTLLSGISKFISGLNFQGFMQFLAAMSPAVITAIGSGMAGIVTRLMQIMELFSQKDVVNAFNIAFRALGVALVLVQGLIMEAMLAWDQLTSALHYSAHYWDDARHWVAGLGHDVATWFDRMRHDVASWAHDVARGFDDVRHGIATLAHDIATWFDRIRHDIAHWADDVVNFFRQLPHRIVAALAALPGMMLALGRQVIDGLLHGLQQAASGVLSWVQGLAGGISGAFSSVLHILSPSRVFFEHGRNTLLGYIQGLQAVAPQVRAAIAAVGGQVAAGGLPGVTGGGYGGAGYRLPAISLTANFAPGMQAYNDPRFLQYLQQVVQEAIVRYQLNNPTSGLVLPGRVM